MNSGTYAFLLSGVTVVTYIILAITQTLISSAQETKFKQNSHGHVNLCDPRVYGHIAWTAYLDALIIHYSAPHRSCFLLRSVNITQC